MAAGGESSTARDGGQVEMHAVVPLTECPHLVQVQEVPPYGVDASSVCSECSSPDEAWICLTCYSVNCGRYIAGHACRHRSQTGHQMALSLSDLSVWCYDCEAYVHNAVLLPAKNAAYRSKFGEALPGGEHADSLNSSHQ